MGAYPSVGWQIDPFGHSATHAALLTGALGLDALFFARSDYQDMEIRAADKALEHLWRGEPSYGSSADVFTGNFPSGDYGPPKGFSFDWLQADPPIVDDTCAFSGSNNVRDRVDAFVEAVEKLAAVGVGEDVMVRSGGDALGWGGGAGGAGAGKMGWGGVLVGSGVPAPPALRQLPALVGVGGTVARVRTCRRMRWRECLPILPKSALCTTHPHFLCRS